MNGEYWIEDGGHTSFADGDVGDYNHEYLAISAIFHIFSDKIISLAQEFGLDTSKVERYGELDTEALSDILNSLNLPDQKLIQELGCNIDALHILLGGGDAREYAMKYLGWIAVRGDNVELFDFAKRRKDLIRGLGEILDSEGVDEDEEIEFSIHDHKTNHSTYMTLADLENTGMRNSLPAVNKSNFILPHDVSKIKSNPNKYNVAAQQYKIIGPGQNLWRRTSESFSAYMKWDFPLAKHIVSGLEVLSDIPNMSSISASLTDYEVLKGIREVPLSTFHLTGKSYSVSETKRIRNLAQQISESQQIKPLIVVIEKAGPYILEGGHRAEALFLLGVKTFPALVVEDLSEL